MTTNERTEEISDVFALDLDEQEDADQAMRDAVQAVEAASRGRRPEAEDDDEDDDTEDTEDTEDAEDADEADAPLSTRERLERLETELAEERERALRALADYENFSRRVNREREEWRRYAGEEALREFLPVVDNLERALSTAGGDEGDLRKGVEMIHRQMLELLQRFGVEPVAAEGEPFDPSVHDAVAREEDDSVEAPVVLQEMQRGYRMRDRLLRPAMVRVAVPPEGSEAQMGADDDEGEAN